MPGRNNWIKLTYDGLPARRLGESFTIEYTERTSRIISFKQACAESAQEIHNYYDKKIYISMSGGSDSECVANSFYNLGLAFVPVIIKIEDYNRHDIRYALHWCQKRNITPMLIEHTVDEWGDILVDYFVRSKNRMLTGVGVMYAGDQVKALGGYLVTGCTDLQLLPDPSLHEQYPSLLTDYFGYYTGWESDFALDQWDPGYHPNGFFTWKPEMLLSFVQDRNPEWANEEAKWYVYDVPPRPKFNGGEYFSYIIQKKHQKIISNGLKLFGKHDWVIYGTKESLMRDLYSNK
jgi:hypothetical protein